MSEYEQILERAREQGINLDGKSILIPTECFENRFTLNGNLCFGRVFENDDKLTLIWERDPRRRMTADEIERELGYKIEVII